MRLPEGIGKYKNNNAWISMLRIFMTFHVVWIHFRPISYDSFLDRFLLFFVAVPVPAFMFISFFLMEEQLWEGNLLYIKKRIIRLIILVLFWNVIVFIYNNFWNVMVAIFHGKCIGFFSIGDMLESILFNKGLTSQFWFINIQVLIIFTIFLLFKLIGNRKAIILLLVVTFVYQYSGVNDSVIRAISENIGTVMKRFVGCVPVALCGILYARVMKYKGYREKLVLLGVLLSLSLVTYKIVPLPPGDYYGGVFTTIISSVVCIIFLTIPDIISGNARIIINYLGSCMMGVYCLHFMVIDFLSIIFRDAMPQSRLFMQFFIYGFCLVLTVFLRIISVKIPWKWLSYVI